MSPPDENPYAAPKFAAERDAAPKFPTVRLTISGMLLALGGLLALLLNGQTFTNLVAFLVMALVSGLLWAPLIARPGDPHALLARLVVLLHAVIALAILWGLPAAYQYQQNFNSKTRQMRARPAELIDMR